MNKDETQILYTAKTHTEDMRKAVFDQRKVEYMRNRHNRPAVFVEKSIK